MTLEDLWKGLAMIWHDWPFEKEFPALTFNFPLERITPWNFSVVLGMTFLWRNRSLHCIHCIIEEEKDHMHNYVGDVAWLYRSYHIYIIFISSGWGPRVFCSSQGRKTGNWDLQVPQKILTMQTMARLWFQTSGFGCIVNFDFAILHLSCLGENF